MRRQGTRERPTARDKRKYSYSDPFVDGLEAEMSAAMNIPNTVTSHVGRTTFKRRQCTNMDEAKIELSTTMR